MVCFITVQVEAEKWLWGDGGGGGAGAKVGSKWQLCPNRVTVTDRVKTKTVFSHLKFSVVIFL